MQSTFCVAFADECLRKHSLPLGAISGGISPSPDIFVKSSISKPGLLVKVAVLGGTRAVRLCLRAFDAPVALADGLGLLALAGKIDND